MLFTSTMAGSSCSKEYQASCYITMALILAIISYTTIKLSRPENPLLLTHRLALNASLALRTHGGFNIMATLIHISPELFFSGPESTIFAIQDSAISNLSIPPLEMRDLLYYHTATSALPKTELLKNTPPFCFKTRLQNKNLMVTETDPKTGSIVINNEWVSQPDMFLEGPVVVHGVSGPFDIMSCSFPNQSSLNVTGEIEWNKIVRVLSSNGFVSFAIGLNAVLDGIIKDHPELGSVTIFAPPNSGFISSPSPFLERTVRIHVLNQRFDYMELVSAGESSLQTLVHGCGLKIDDFSEKISINGVEITAPDVFSSEKFVIHGIPRTFDVEKLFSSSK